MKHVHNGNGSGKIRYAIVGLGHIAQEIFRPRAVKPRLVRVEAPAV